MPLTDSPKFASICQFFHLFDFSLVLSNISDRLELELTSPTDFLKELVVKLLKNYYKSRNTRLNLDNMMFYCCKEMKIKKYEDVETFENVSIEQLDPFARLDLVYFLTELQLDGHDWKYLRMHEDLCIGWRVEPIGIDSFKSKYWLFDDSRLYREFEGEIIPQIVKEATETAEPVKQNATESNIQLISETGEARKIPKLKLILGPPTVKPPTQPWKLICKSDSDWYNIVKLFESSTHPDEVALYHTLLNLVPLIIEDITRKKKETEVRALIEESNETLTVSNSAILDEDQSVKEEVSFSKRKSRNSLKVELNLNDIEAVDSRMAKKGRKLNQKLSFI